MPYTYDYPRPCVTTDAVVFALRDGGLRVCLVKRGREPFAGHWVMPGGFLGMEERAVEGARRELAEETGLAEVRLAFLKPFDDPERDPRGRVISLAFFGVAGPEAQLQAGDDAAEAAWADAFNPPPLAFDHGQMLQDALESLRRSGRESDMLFGMLPVPCPVGLALKAYEAVYQEGADEQEVAARAKEGGVVLGFSDLVI